MLRKKTFNKRIEREGWLSPKEKFTKKRKLRRWRLKSSKRH